MQFVVRFSRSPSSTGPDAVLVTAARYAEGYHEGHLVAYRFFDGDGEEVAMVRADEVTYVALAGHALEPGPAAPPAEIEAPEGEAR